MVLGGGPGWGGLGCAYKRARTAGWGSRAPDAGPHGPVTWHFPASRTVSDEPFLLLSPPSSPQQTKTPPPAPASKKAEGRPGGAARQTPSWVVLSPKTLFGKRFPVSLAACSRAGPLGAAGDTEASFRRISGAGRGGGLYRLAHSAALQVVSLDRGATGSFQPLPQLHAVPGPQAAGGEGRGQLTVIGPRRCPVCPAPTS